MRSRMIAACFGMAMTATLPALPSVSVLLLLVLLLVIAVTLWRKKRLGGLLIAFLLGLLWSLCFAQWRLSSALPAYLEGRDFWVTGRVTGLPQDNARAQQVHFHVEHSCFDLLPAQCAIDNRVFRNRHILLNYYGEERLAPGQRWFWRVRLSTPRGFANPGGFDYAGWLFQQGISARGYVRDTAFNHGLEEGGAWLSRVRQRVREEMLAALHGRPNKGILVALVLGDREQVSAENWALFTQTGTNHLIVISGLHVGFVAWLCHVQMAWLVRLVPPLLLRLPAQQWGAVAAGFGAIFYSMLAGFSVPTQRACIMVLVFVAARLLARRLPHSFSFCLALLLVLAANPMSVIGAGFWLSFGAVGTLLFAFHGIRRLHHRAAVHGERGTRMLTFDGNRFWKQWARPQWVVFIGMTVPLAVWMQQVSLLAPVANVLAIPLVSLLIVPLCLLGAMLLFVLQPAGTQVLAAADMLLSGLAAGLHALVGLPLSALWEFHGTSLLEIFLALVGSVLLLMPRGWPGRWLGAILLLPLAVPSENQPMPGVAQITVLDVGQGQAVLVQTASHALLYDTGPRFSESFDAGAGIIIPLLRSRGVRRLDTVVVSHADNDHAGGLASVLSALPVARVLAGEAPEASMLPVPDGSMAALCIRGQRWQWDDVQFSVLWPPAGQNNAGNDSSCVLRIEAGGRVMLLTGDIEAGAESALVRADGERLRSTWLVAPHHGSQTSSTIAFLDSVKPRGVIFSAGYRSQFRHPAPAVAARYHSRGIPAWNTALRGALSVCLGASEYCADEPLSWRETRRRWWQPPDSEASRQLHGELPTPLQPL